MLGGNKKRLLRLSEKTSITRVTTSVRFRARAGKPWEVHCEQACLSLPKAVGSQQCLSEAIFNLLLAYPSQPLNL